MQCLWIFNFYATYLKITQLAIYHFRYACPCGIFEWSVPRMRKFKDGLSANVTCIFHFDCEQWKWSMIYIFYFVTQIYFMTSFIQTGIIITWIANCIVYVKPLLQETNIIKCIWNKCLSYKTSCFRVTHACCQHSQSLWIRVNKSRKSNAISRGSESITFCDVQFIVPHSCSAWLHATCHLVTVSI